MSMLKNIIELLQVVNGETTRIQIAQGRYYLPNNWKKGLHIAKRLAKWESKK